MEDVVERSIRDVLDVVPDEFKPYGNGAPLRLKPYEPYVSHNVSGMGLFLVYEPTAIDSLSVRSNHYKISFP